jgi:hypothetical protein
MQEDVRAAVYRGDHVYAAVAAVAGTDSRALAGSPPPGEWPLEPAESAALALDCAVRAGCRGHVVISGTD